MTGEQFEQMVRETARAMWHLPPEGGAAETIDGQEIDCVCRTDDLVHLIECTTERKQDKVIKQVNKLVAAKRAEERHGNTVKMWIVTSEEPTPDQTTVAKKEGVTLLSFERFQDRLLDARNYLEARRHYAFGSARDPKSEAWELAEDEYVPVPMHDRESRRSHTIRSVADLLQGE